VRDESGDGGLDDGEAVAWKDECEEDTEDEDGFALYSPHVSCLT